MHAIGVLFDDRWIYSLITVAVELNIVPVDPLIVNSQLVLH
jgi:hypothetical protein